MLHCRNNNISYEKARFSEPLSDGTNSWTYTLTGTCHSTHSGPLPSAHLVLFVLNHSVSSLIVRGVSHVATGKRESEAQNEAARMALIALGVI